ncbi:MAG: DUF4168 domain-containing protein [Cyanobacteria bacterium J06621_11]
MFRSLQQLGTSLKPHKISLKALLTKGLSLAACLIFWGVALCASFTGKAYAAEMAISNLANNLEENVPAVVAPALAEGTEIAAEKIDQFSQAYLQVLALLSDREAEISAAPTNADALKIEQSIETDAVQIIKSSGLSMSEYMQILELASQDSSFQDKILGRMDEAENATP